MFTNKHVIVALLVAPVLSLLAWYAVGNLLGDRPTSARTGEAYPLLEKSNCRYKSGVCELENEDVQLTLRPADTGMPALLLSASHPLEAAMMSVADPQQDPGPRPMQPLDETGEHWRLPLGANPNPTQRVRLVVSIAGSAYFAEASTAFMHSDRAP